MIFDCLDYPYSSKRTVVFSNKGVVATSQYLAAQAGLEALKAGGNAVDAAIASAACLTVTEPTSNGIGGDAFAIIFFNNQIYGLNASGKAPQQLTRESLKEQGLNKIPPHGWESVTVPGIPSAWQDLNKRFGTLPLTKLLEPAVNYAQEGFPVSPVVSYNWNIAFNKYCKLGRDDIYKEWFNVFTVDGRTPKPGEVWSSQKHARTLQILAESDCESFYRGNIADQIIEYTKKTKGYLTYGDLENFKPQWVKPLSLNYRGFDIWELPPNGQGLIVLLALNILKNYDLKQFSQSEISHKQMEAIKLAFHDGFKNIADPEFVSIPIEELLSNLANVLIIQSFQVS